MAALVVLGPVQGIRVPRRMNRLWPEAGKLSRADRAAVVHATRRGEIPADPGLPPRSSRTPAPCGGPRRRTGCAAGPSWPSRCSRCAGYDTLAGTTGETISSWLVTALCLADLVWWPRSRSRLLDRAGRATASARP
ncbi:hypothetical protein [Streptomyces sp. NRRL B-3648]|uniref:hypothetical protein n=1 Tax=Streptomyces sp. NRRL B-3648 TaxID=1519493 RepID=UPI0006B03FA5|nr:hypothetical protein [Streptomyces sp. NRRL B-3648]KOV96142.1 hypothetical protein ADL04_18385 [Streptomyces sp. NRRL B-3648]